MKGDKLCGFFDHSSCQAAMPNDDLDASKTSVNPSDKQTIMRDGW